MTAERKFLNQTHNTVLGERLYCPAFLPTLLYTLATVLYKDLE
jgi:hypothetical protein